MKGFELRQRGLWHAPTEVALPPLLVHGVVEEL